MARRPAVTSPSLPDAAPKVLRLPQTEKRVMRQVQVYRLLFQGRFSVNGHQGASCSKSASAGCCSKGASADTGKKSKKKKKKEAGDKMVGLSKNN